MRIIVVRGIGVPPVVFMENPPDDFSIEEYIEPPPGGNRQELEDFAELMKDLINNPKYERIA
jgi:hypothetical protein